MPGISSLIPELQPYANELVRVAGQARLNPRITSARRTRTQQARLYRAYLAGASTYPVAPPGTSPHEFGWAFDMVTSPLEALNELGTLWESWGGVWGGRFSDEVHFEYPGFPRSAPKKSHPLDAIGRAYEDLPWWAQLVVPTQLTPTTEPIGEPPRFVRSGVQWLGQQIDELFR